MKRVYVNGVIGLAAVTLLRLIIWRSSNSKMPIELIHVELNRFAEILRLVVPFS